MPDVPSRIIELVERFERNREQYINSAYNEAQTRIEFIDPLFEALGWDIANKAGYSESYKSVIHEDTIKVSGTAKAPDYSFRIGKERKFFLEAKKPAVNIEKDKDSALQLRRYGWSAKLPLSILTNFEKLAVYDCRIRPSKFDPPHVTRVMYFDYQEYSQRWKEISSVFSRDAILKGSFDKYADSSRDKKGTAEVDTAFLKEIEAWREALARDLAWRKSPLTQEEMNFVVQRTIDRIIFLRISEDRGVEEYGRLQALINGERIYERLIEIFRRADERYNSGLFHFQQEKGRHEEPDDLTPGLIFSNKIFHDIILSLYYPQSPYQFSVLPADILGQVYEQFLGKVIRYEPGRRIQIDDKPEVKKAGGVYYTPTYIVDYIVRQTVGKLLEKAGTPVKTAKIKILDPACGSGSFLIAAYQYLLDWHLDWYIKHDPETWARKKNPPIYQAPATDGRTAPWRLTTQERKKILLDNVFGVDIDPQAVEVTKLSLLLKVLEQQSAETINHNLTSTHERVLPDLGKNIKCGNSLISNDFDTAGLSGEELRRINPFDWNVEFADIVKSGGFDAVIGNPPWGSFFTNIEKVYLWSHYINRRGEAESHLFFIERGFRLLRSSGILGFITPNTWLSILNSQELRGYLLDKATFHEICELSKYIFKDAPDIVPILIFIGGKGSSPVNCVIKRASNIKICSGNFSDAFQIDRIAQKVWLKSPGMAINLRVTPLVLRVIEKCNAVSGRLSQLAEVLYGIKTGDNNKYLSKSQSNTHRMKALKTGEISRYNIEWKGLFLWWCDKLAGYRTSSIEVPKIVIQYIRKISLPRRIIAGLDVRGEFYPLNNYSYIVAKDVSYSLEYLLGILNSDLLNFYYKNTFVDYNIKPTYLQQLPIRTINFDDPVDKARHDKMVGMVDRMLSLHKQLAAAKTPDKKTRIKRQIDSTDHDIDKLVYELYDLTDEEIKIVEEEL